MGTGTVCGYGYIIIGACVGREISMQVRICKYVASMQVLWVHIQVCG